MPWCSFAASCAPDCPAGYVDELDQCVQQVAPHPCEVLPTTKVDANETVVMSRVDISENRCFWIDQNEVTVKAYSQWIEEQPEVPRWESDFCQWKTERSDPVHDRSACDEPLSALDRDPFGASKPIRCVDFCDAEAFCRWNGKHLCYDFAIAGVTSPRGYPRQWRLTCSNDLTTERPWGDEPDDMRCNVDQAERGCPDNSCGPTAVGRFDGCKTSHDVADMIGNVAEWTYACNALDPSRPTCLTRGGSYDAPGGACVDEKNIANASRLPSLGFRCCAELTVSEMAQIE